MGTIKTELGIEKIPSSLGYHIISASGADGRHGQVYDTTAQDKAGTGRSGNNGRNAAPPGDGERSRDPQIQLTYKSHSPGYVQVEDEVEPQFSLAREKLLRVTARGGNGGDGGFGEAGQHGGRGYGGADATQSSSGSNGGPGGAGGDGGYGTDGGRGGRGGHVQFIVNEHDLDLLLVIDWDIDVHGGKGGKKGGHGIAGKGGKGGSGGSSYSWSVPREVTNSDGTTETIYDHYSNPGGSRGPRGKNGREPQTILKNGEDGKNGNFKILVMNSDGTSISYPHRYYLVVESFEVQDENSDGVNEPGEFISVKNICIHNTGPMPSPSGQLLKIIIRASPWLDPDVSLPLILPDSILPGSKVTVTGQLRAQIRHEKISRGSGVPLFELETVSLFCYSERVRRALPELSGRHEIKIEYPLRLGRPTYMDCMTRNDEMAIYWVVENISTKLLGDQSTSRRRARTTLIDRNRRFVLEHVAVGEASVQDNIPVIDSEECALGEKVTVADDTPTNSFGILGLVLELEDPHLDQMTQVMFWDLPLQVSEEYNFDPKAEFLFVVNASTDVEAIAQMQRFIGKTLRLKTDILNLSLSGSCKDHELDESILRRYQGKSIIITSNSFNSHVDTIRYNWELMDPNDVLFLAMNGTSFLFCGMRSQRARDRLQTWLSLMGFVDPETKNPNTSDILVMHNKQRDLLKSLREEGKKSFIVGTIGEYSPSDALDFLRRKSASELLERGGQNLLKHLDEAEPSRRFIVSSLTRQNKATKATSNLIIAECLSNRASCIVSSSPIRKPNKEQLTSHQCAMMVASIPFRSLVRIFWNIISSVQWNGISAAACYRKLPGFYMPFDSMLRFGQKEKDDGSRLISPEVCDAVALAIRLGIESDIRQVCNTSGLTELGSKGFLDHAPLLAQFLGAIPSEDESATASEAGIGLATWVLGSVDIAMKSSNILKAVLGGIPGLTSRRSRLRRHAQDFKKDAISFMAPPSEAATISKGIDNAKKDHLKEQKNESKTVQWKIHQRLDLLYKEQVAESYKLLDLSMASKGSVYVSPAEFKTQLSAYQTLLSQQESNLVLTQEARNEMILNIGIEQSFVPLGSLKLA